MYPRKVSRHQSVTNSAIFIFRAQIWWGRWESNPHELPRPLLRRLRLPFRHFPVAGYGCFSSSSALSLGGVPCCLDAEAQFHGPSCKGQCHEQGSAGPSHVECATSPACQRRIVRRRPSRMPRPSRSKALRSVSPGAKAKPEMLTRRAVEPGWCGSNCLTDGQHIALAAQCQRPAKDRAALRNVGRVVRACKPRRGKNVESATGVRAVKRTGRKRVCVWRDIIARRSRRLRIGRISQ